VGNTKIGYAWQYGRFQDDLEFWRARVSQPNEVKPVKDDRCIRMYLVTADDLHAFHTAVSSQLDAAIWASGEPEEEPAEAALAKVHLATSSPAVSLLRSELLVTATSTDRHRPGEGVAEQQEGDRYLTGIARKQLQPIPEDEPDPEPEPRRNSPRLFRFWAPGGRRHDEKRLRELRRHVPV
jgi:hypothetical protein